MDEWIAYDESEPLATIVQKGLAVYAKQKASLAEGFWDTDDAANVKRWEVNCAEVVLNELARRMEISLG